LLTFSSSCDCYFLAFYPSIVILSWRHCSPASVTHRPSRSPAWHPQHPGTGLQGLTNTHRTTHNSVSGCKANTYFPTTDCISPRFPIPREPEPDAGFFRRHSLLHSPAGQQTDRRIAGIVTWS
jgi:hypothetical protein